MTTSIDVRTRTSDDLRAVDPVDFLDHELPALLEARGHRAVDAARWLELRSTTLLLPTQAWTISFDGDRFRAARGDDGATAVDLDEASLADLVNDTKTPMTFLTAGTLSTPRGDLGDLLSWWVVLRAVIDDRAAHAPGALALREADGRPLDLGRSFAPDADDADLGRFLAEAGFLHLAGWLDPDLMAQVSADMDAALPTYAPDDGRSWWARTRDGDHRCVRMQWFDEHSPATRALLDGPVLERLASLTGDGHAVSRFGSSRVEALVKPLGVVEGISDVPWHKDCSLGMHSYGCSGLTIGVSVTGADAESGQLKVVAGSHRALMQPAFVRRDLDLPIVALPTQTGDLTVHCSCTMHMAQPPVTRERRVLYTGVKLPPLGHGEGLRASQQELGRVREGSYKAVSQKPAGG